MRSVFGNRGTEVQFDTGKAEDASRFFDPPATCRTSLRCWAFNTRSHRLRFGIRARIRPCCRDDPVGLGSPQLQVFQEPSRIADELSVVARRKLKRYGDFLYERHAIF